MTHTRRVCEYRLTSAGCLCDGVCLLCAELLSQADVEPLLQATGCSSELMRPRCDTGCLSQRYRSFTGECNNRSQHGSSYAASQWLI